MAYRYSNFQLDYIFYLFLSEPSDTICTHTDCLDKRMGTCFLTSLKTILHDSHLEFSNHTLFSTSYFSLYHLAHPESTCTQYKEATRVHTAHRWKLFRRVVRHLSSPSINVLPSIFKVSTAFASSI